MFRELVDLGRRLEKLGKLPSPGFYEYGASIKWVVHVGPDRVDLEQSDLPLARPFSGRTSGREEHLLADEAGYALGVNRTADGGEDGWASDKHSRFRKLFETFRTSDMLQDGDLREAIGWLSTAMDRNAVASDERYEQIDSKAWVSFVPTQGALAGKHLFEHSEAKAFWLREMQRRTAAREEGGERVITGECSVCGRRDQPLVRKLPVGVKLVGNTPLHSLNADAFTSYVGGTDTASRAHLGLCFECGDTAARAFNYLSNSEQHRRTLYRHPRSRDSLANMYALFWLKAPRPVVVGSFDLDLTDIDFGALLGERPKTPTATLSQLTALLDQPWSPKNAAFRLDDYAFYLAILSPNVGRIAVRDWIAVSLRPLLDSLRDFVYAGRIVSPWGESVQLLSLATIIDALGEGGADLQRSLIRSAFTGVRPPAALAVMAGQRLRYLFANEATLREKQRARAPGQTRMWNERWPHALASAIKLALFYRLEEVGYMESVNPLFQSKAYHSGRLLAMLEEAQQIYSFRQYGERLDRTLVDHGYGGASTAPAATLAPLLRLATTAHLPKCGGWVHMEVEQIMSTLVGLEGFPETLSLREQAEFGLGFYHQRAAIRAKPRSDKHEKEEQPSVDE